MVVYCSYTLHLIITEKYIISAAVKKKKKDEKKDVLPPTEKQVKKYKEQNFCHIWKQLFDEEFNEVRDYCQVLDHCYYAEKYRGAAHSICNLRYKTAKLQRLCM